MILEGSACLGVSHGIDPWTMNAHFNALFSRVRPTMQALIARATPTARDNVMVFLWRILNALDGPTPQAVVPPDDRAQDFDMCAVCAISWEWAPFFDHHVWVIHATDAHWRVPWCWSQQVPPNEHSSPVDWLRFWGTEVAGWFDDDDGVHSLGRSMVPRQWTARTAHAQACLDARIGHSMGYTPTQQPSSKRRITTPARSLLPHIDWASELFADDMQRHILEYRLSYLPHAVTAQGYVEKITELGLKRRLTCHFHDIGSDQNTAEKQVCHFSVFDDFLAAVARLIVRRKIAPPTPENPSDIHFAFTDVPKCFNTIATQWRDGDVQSYAHPRYRFIVRGRFFGFGHMNAPAAESVAGMLGVVDMRARGFGATPVPDTEIWERGVDTVGDTCLCVDDYIEPELGRVRTELNLADLTGLLDALGQGHHKKKSGVAKEGKFYGKILHPDEDMVRITEAKRLFMRQNVLALLAYRADHNGVLEGTFVSTACRLNWAAAEFPPGESLIQPFFVLLYPDAKSSVAVMTASMSSLFRHGDPFRGPHDSSRRAYGRTMAIDLVPTAGRIWNKRAFHPVPRGHIVELTLQRWADLLSLPGGRRAFLFWPRPGFVVRRWSYSRLQHQQMDVSHRTDPFDRSVAPEGFPIFTSDAQPTRGYSWFGSESFMVIGMPLDWHIMVTEFVMMFYSKHVHPFEFFDPKRLRDQQRPIDSRLGMRGDNTSSLDARMAGRSGHPMLHEWVVEDCNEDAAKGWTAVAIGISTHDNTIADDGSRGKRRPHTDDYHFSDWAFHIVRSLASRPHGYTIESHASVSGDNCRAPRWGHRFCRFDQLAFSSHDDALINAPFRALVTAMRELEVQHRAVDFEFTFVLPLAPKTIPFVPRLRERLANLGAKRAHTFNVHEPVFMMRKNVYIWPDRSAGFVLKTLQWPVELWRYSH